MFKFTTIDFPFITKGSKNFSKKSDIKVAIFSLVVLKRAIKNSSASVLAIKLLEGRKVFILSVIFF